MLEERVGNKTDKNFCLHGTEILVRKKPFQMLSVADCEKPKRYSKQKETKHSKHFFQYLWSMC